MKLNQATQAAPVRVQLDVGCVWLERIHRIVQMSFIANLNLRTCIADANSVSSRIWGRAALGLFNRMTQARGLCTVVGNTFAIYYTLYSDRFWYNVFVLYLTQFYPISFAALSNRSLHDRINIVWWSTLAGTSSPCMKTFSRDLTTEELNPQSKLL